MRTPKVAIGKGRRRRGPGKDRYFHDNPRRHGRVPYVEGMDRFEIREQMAGERNIAELINSLVKRRGFALQQAGAAQWPSHLGHWEWLAGMRLLELTLRRLVLLNGSAREWEKQGRELGVFDPPQFTEMPLEETLDFARDTRTQFPPSAPAEVPAEEAADWSAERRS